MGIVSPVAKKGPILKKNGAFLFFVIRFARHATGGNYSN